MTAPDPQLIAAILKSDPNAGADPETLAELICRAHEIRGEMARLDKEAKHLWVSSARLSALAAERRAVQSRCPHPVVERLWNGHSTEGRECVVCGVEVE